MVMFAVIALLGLVSFCQGDPMESPEFQFASSAALHIISATGADRIYTDSGTGADQDLAVFKPQLTSGYYMLGYHAQRNHNGSPGQTIKIVKPLVDGAITAPSYSIKMWDDRGTGGRQDVSFWHVYCLPGYVGLGDVISVGYHDPTNEIKSTYACIRADLVIQSTVGALIWWDRGSGGDSDGSMWSTKCNTENLGYQFQAQRGYGAPPNQRFYCLK